MYRRALDGHEKAWGPDYTSTSDTANSLRLLKAMRGKHMMLEETHSQALDRNNETRHQSTSTIITPNR